MKLFKTIALILALTLFAVGCGKNKTAEITDSELANLGNSNGNINNLGSICADDENMYYQKGEGFFLYKSDLKGGNETELNGAETYFINSYKDKLYYADASDGFSIYSMNKDGSDKARIIEAAAYYVSVYKDNIYYVDFDDNQKIYRADLDGSNVTKISDDSAFYVTPYGNRLYYVNLSDGAKVYSIGLDGTSHRCIIDSYSGYINLYNDCIYYTMPNNPQTNTGDDAIYKFSLLDSTNEKISSAAATDINIYNGRIYYRDLNQKAICSCDLNGGDVKTEAEDDGVFISIAKGKMLYLVKNDDGKNQLKSKELT